jgi:hypothetical protein
MALGNPFVPAPAGGVVFSYNTNAATNTTFLTPLGSDVLVTNFNTSGGAFVLLSIVGAANTVASAGNGAPVPPNFSIMLKAPWPAAFTGAAQISAIATAGSNTGNIAANCGYGTML